MFMRFECTNANTTDNVRRNRRLLKASVRKSLRIFCHSYIRSDILVYTFLSHRITSLRDACIHFIFLQNYYYFVSILFSEVVNAVEIV